MSDELFLFLIKVGFRGDSGGRRQFAWQISPQSNFRRLDPLYPGQTRGGPLLRVLVGSRALQLRHFSLQRPTSAPRRSVPLLSPYPSATPPTRSLLARPQLVQLPLQRLVAVVHLHVAALQLLLVADDLVLLRLPRPPLLLERRGLGLALAALQQELGTQPLLRRAPAASCNEKVHMTLSYMPAEPSGVWGGWGGWGGDERRRLPVKRTPGPDLIRQVTPTSGPSVLTS